MAKVGAADNWRQTSLERQRAPPLQSASKFSCAAPFPWFASLWLSFCATAAGDTMNFNSVGGTTNPGLIAPGFSKTA